MELIDRKDKELQELYLELDEVKSGLKKGLMLQDELFVRHHQKLLDFDDDTKSLKDMNRDLETTNQELIRKIELYEKSLNVFKSNDQSRVESRLVELTQRGAIEESNMIRLSRKFASLKEEHEELLEKWRNAQVGFTEKETQLLASLEGLLAWKEEASEKLRILLERGRQSVSLEDHRATKTELELAQEKYANLKIREAELINQMTITAGKEREYNDQIDKVRQLEDELSAAEVEIEVLSLRLRQIDPIFRKFSLVFQRISKTMKDKNVSPLQVFEMFDSNKDGTLQMEEMTQAFQAMGIVTDTSENEILHMMMDLDGSGALDYKEFVRKLKRSGVAVRTKEEEVVNRIWNCVTKANLTLDQAFKVFDRDQDKLISFDDIVNSLTSLGIKVEPAVVGELFRIADVTGDGKIDYSEFIYIFKKYNKVSYERAEDTQLDWKFDVMARLEKVSRDKDVSLEEIFDSLDVDGDGTIDIKELGELFAALGTKLEDQAMQKLFFAIDTSKSGHISFTEFLSFINRAKIESERVSRAKLIQNKKLQQMQDEDMDGDTAPENDPATKYQLKLSLLEAKDKSSQRQIQKLILKLQQVEEQLQREEQTVKSLEDASTRTKKEYFEEKQKRSKIEMRYQTGITKEKAQEIQNENQQLKIKTSQLSGALQTFRTLHEAAINEAKALRVSIARDKDEVAQLRHAIIEMQGEADEKALIGKLYKKNLNLKWTEANSNQRYDALLDSMRKLKIQNSDLMSKMKLKDAELFDIQSVFTEKLMILERELKDARLSILPTVSISRIEELNGQIKRLAEAKLELEISNKKLRETNYEYSVKVDNYSLRERNLQDLEVMLKEQHPDELSVRVMEMSQKLTDYRLKELKSQREVYLVKEREDYYARINRTQVDHIKKLEEELAKSDSKFNEREEFWRRRYNDQLKIAQKEQFENVGLIDKDGNVIEKGSAATGKKLTDVEARNAIHLDMAKQVSMSKDLRSVQKDLSMSALGQDALEDLRERLRIMTEDNANKQQRIDILKDELKTKEVNINYQTKNIDQISFGRLENDTKQLANAAQQTILTLQTMVDEKTEELEQREKQIAQLQKDKLENAKELRKMHLENEALKREQLTAEAGRINMEHMSNVKLLTKIGKMDHKEMEKLVMDYEHKIRVLTEELSECEKTNAELVNRLRGERLERNKLENRHTKDAADLGTNDLRKEVATLNAMNKKKNGELIQLKKLIEELKKDLLSRDEDLVKQEKNTSEKISLTQTQTGEVEIKLAGLTKRFTDLNTKFKDSNLQIKSLKLAEIKSNEELTKLKEENLNLKNQNAKFRDDNLKLKKKFSSQGLDPVKSRDNQDDADDKSDEKITEKTTMPQINKQRRPSSGKIPASPGQRPAKSQKLMDQDDLKIQKLEKKIAELEKINLDLTSQLKADFIDEDEKILVSVESSAFKSLEEMTKTIKKYLDLNKAIKLFPIMSKSDIRNLGLAKADELVVDLSRVGIKFSKFDQENFLKWVPQDKLGNVKYPELYDQIFSLNNQNTMTTQSTKLGSELETEKAEVSNLSLKKYGMVASRDAARKPPPPSPKQHDAQHDVPEETLLQQTRNVNLLKKRLDEKNDEIRKLQNQLNSWREKYLKLEIEMKEKQNKQRQVSIPVSANEIDPKLPNQTTAFKMIKELEDQVAEAHRQMNFEVERRDSEILSLTEKLDTLVTENRLVNSENETMRVQLEKIFTQRLTPNQISEEKEKQRELLLSSLMAKLEKSRIREDKLSEKIVVLEKENIELKFVKEGIETRIESLNRTKRDLESSKRP